MVGCNNPKRGPVCKVCPNFLIGILDRKRKIAKLIEQHEQTMIEIYGEEGVKALSKKQKQRIAQMIEMYGKEGVKALSQAQKERIAQMIQEDEETYGEDQFYELAEQRKKLLSRGMPAFNEWCPESLVTRLIKLNPDKGIYTHDNMRIVYDGDPTQLKIPEGFYLKEGIHGYRISNKQFVIENGGGDYADIPIY